MLNGMWSLLSKVNIPIGLFHGPMDAMTPVPSGEPRGGMWSAHVLSSIAAAWILSVAFDLFLHGGLLARVYMAPSPFLLPLEDAFRRIPLGYVAFLGLTIALQSLGLAPAMKVG